MKSLLARLSPLVALSIGAAAAQAAQSGFVQTTVSTAGAPITVALYYPTEAAERRVPMGPFTLDVAPGAAPAGTVKGLLLLSHGTGGSELGHGRLAQALARGGYLVAALRHPGDNWQDHSLLTDSPQAFFDERPRQARAVIDALLADPRWKDRIARDARGPRVGALGHSAGGYTVIALAGGRPDLGRIRVHCAAEAAEDPIFCGMGRPARPDPAASAPAHDAGADLADPRVRAVAALSPVGAVFTPGSLAAIRVPVAIHVAALDRFLVPRFHGAWLAAQIPGATMTTVPNAWHFAFIDTPTMPIPSPDGDLAADPPGFDRAAYLQSLGQELLRFFDASW